MLDQFGGGVWIAELAAVKNPSEVTRSIIGALPSHPTEPTLDALADILGQRDDTLLILDNCEHVIDSAAEAAYTLASRVTSLRILCTSREPLDIEGERVLYLETLKTSANGSTVGTAEELFIERALQAGAVIDTLEPSLVTRACHAIDGLPLALELAAARTTALPLEHLVLLLEQDAGAALNRRGGDARQRNLDSLVRWSIDLLDPHTRDALLALSLLQARMPLHEVIGFLKGIPSIGAGAATYLGELARRSLVEIEGDDVLLLFTVRSVATKMRLENEVLDKQAQGALIDWTIDWAAKATDWRSLRWVEQIASLEPIVRAAVNLAAEKNDLRISDVLDAIKGHYDIAGVPEDLMHSLLMLANLPSTNDGTGFRTQLQAINVALGMAIESLPVEQLPDMHELITTADAIGSLHERVLARRVASRAALNHGHYEISERFGREIVGLATGTDPKIDRLAAAAILDLGVCRHLAGDLESAIEHYLEAIEHLRGVESLNVGVGLNNVGEAYLDLGRPRDAVEPLIESLLHAPPRGTVASVATALRAEALLKLGQKQEGTHLREQAIDLLETLVERAPACLYYLDRLKALDFD